MEASKARKLEQLQAMIDAVPATVDPGFEEGEFEVAYGEAASSQIAEPPKSETAKGHSNDPRAAYDRIIALCGFNDFSRHKMRERLQRESYPADAIEAALERAVNVGLIDDLRWGEMRVCALMRRGMGNAGIMRDLNENGIDAFALRGWPDEYEEAYGTEIERANRFLAKNPPRGKNLRSSAYGKLVRKGFGADVAMRVSSEWSASERFSSPSDSVL